MKKYTLISLLLLSSSLSGAQLPKIDVGFREEMLSRKTNHYRRMLECQQQITTNQEQFDIRYYALDLAPDPATAHLTGIAELVAEVTAPTLDRVELNFWDGMTITGIHSSAAPDEALAFNRQNDLLTIHLERAYNQGEQFQITIRYDGHPQQSPYGSFNFDVHDGEPMIWTLSSVFGARAWWPCKDVPSDKPDSMDIRVTVPSNLIVASNGSLRQTEVNGNRTTYWWHEKYPIATYLVSLAIHPYEVHYDQYVYNGGHSTMPIYFYSFPGNYEIFEGINDLVKDMLACYADLFGEYPFVDEKYGQADFPWGGGMEHQTCTSYGSWNEGLFAHEIAHQWWGDMITCDSFHHIWLNEGFASYCEALWYEYSYPPFTASEYQVMYQLYLGPGTVYVEDPENEDIFDSGLSYVKGSWILHMLRHVVGDEDFFAILKAYYASAPNKYGTATTQEFQAICEQVSGMNLDKFFYQWIHEEYYPRYAYSWNSIANGQGYEINLEIRQEQSNYVFWMPIDVTLTTAAGETIFVVRDSLSTQSFQFRVSSEPLNLELDKNNWILKLRPERIGNPTFDRGILLVNGVLFDVYGEEIRDSYENRAFWGDFSISFWDCFFPSPGGYPSTLPAPLGYGSIPADVLGQFSTVIWVGNDYGGDLGSWQQTSILPYLEAGGNLLLMTRRGQNFIDSELREYLGIDWTGAPDLTIYNCVATHSGLIDIPLSGSQSSNAMFDIGSIGDESTLLFMEQETSGGIGIWRDPAEGGEYRSNGGQFVFISGRPYRYNSEQLRSNVEFMLTHFMNEGNSGTVDDPVRFTLDQNFPNPFNNATTISYFLDQAANVSFKIYDIRGESIKLLVDDETVSGGLHRVAWDGTNANGARVSSGVYFYQLNCGESSGIGKMLLLR